MNRGRSLPRDFDALNEHGGFLRCAAIAVPSEQDSQVEAARSVMRSRARESCCQRKPRRVATEKAVALLQSKCWDTALLGEFSKAMADASICGLGQATPNPVRCVMKTVPNE